MISTPHKKGGLPQGVEANALSVLSLGKLPDFSLIRDAVNPARLKQ